MKKLQLIILLVNIFILNISAQNNKIELVKDILPGSSSSNIDNLTKVGSLLYFSADDGTKGKELWKSDGTNAGTQMVLDINNVGSASSYPDYLTTSGNFLYFSANDGTNGNELWKLQYTPAGNYTPSMVKNINPNANSSAPYKLTDLNNTLIFWASDGTNGTELWKSDGTAANTEMIRDINLGVSSSPTNDLFKVGNSIFFKGGGGLNAGLCIATETNVSNPISVRNFNGEIIQPAEYGKLGTTLIFSGIGSNGANNVGRELFVKEADDFAVDLLKDINTGESSSYPSNFINSGGFLFFTANNGSQTSLWKTDGTMAGTVLVKSIMPNTNFFNFCSISSTLFFCTGNSNGLQLWKSDGTTLGTTIVKAIDNSPVVSNYEAINHNGTLFFTIHDDANGIELWQSNGTSAGTFMVQDINPTGSSYPLNLTSVGGDLFFTASNGSQGIELFKLYNCFGAAENYTTKNGNWNDPTVWACGRVPATTEQITIKGHIININGNFGVNKIIFEGGNITMPVGSTLTYYPIVP